MDTKDIRSFIECYETRSINMAAKSLFITPQGLGKILDRLEHEIKLPLFDRTAKGLVPTDAGVLFYEKSLKLLEYMNEIEAGINSLRRTNKQLRIGYSCGLLRIRRTKAIKDFERNHPELEISWEEGINSNIKEKLMNKQLDIGFVIGRMPTKDMVEREIFSKKVCAIVNKDNPLYKKDAILVKDLKGEQLITLNENYQLYSNLLASCEREGFYPNVRIKTMESSMIYQLASDRLGLGIDADIHGKEFVKEGLRLIPIEDFIPWTGYLVYGREKEKDEVLQQFLKTVPTF